MLKPSDSMTIRAIGESRRRADSCRPFFIAIGCLLAVAPSAIAQAKPAPDEIVFKNGDMLTGHFNGGTGNSIAFKSDSAGDITVSLDNVKELHVTGSFAVLRKDHPVAQVAEARAIAPGTISYSDAKLTVNRPTTGPEVVPEAQIAFIVEAATYGKEVSGKEGPFNAWNGNLNGGATLVRATDYGETFTTGISLVRATPTVSFLAPRDRTTFNLQETYGKLTSPVIPQTVPASPAAVTVTSIFHADAEQDEYFSPRFYALGQTAFDHNYSQGLSLQQIYGGGIGWTAIKNDKQQLDLKATIQYERQSFKTASNNKNLIGSTISEAYRRNLPKKLLFTESANFIPAFTNSSAYSFNVSAGLALPVYKRLSVNFSTTDNYLNDPSADYNKNSYQLVTGISYALK
jgi:opacity protein-like surface antigen